MFKGTVLPYESDDQGTFCDLEIGDGQGFARKWKCAGLPMALNFPAEGTYTMRWDPSTTKHPNGVYRILGVPGSPNDEMHVGNFAGDVSKGWSSDVTGCLIPGTGVGYRPNRVGTNQKVVTSSGVAVAEIIAFTNKQDVELTVGGLPSTEVKDTV